MALEGLEEVPVNLECTICMKLLLEPVSVPCGHTFCRSCLQQSLGYRSVCAVCRAPVPAGYSVNVLIRNVIAEQYPRALAQRQKERDEDLNQADHLEQEERQREVQQTLGSGAANSTEIFPLLRLPKIFSPHLPYELELSTFEEEQAVQYAIQGGRQLCILQPHSDTGVCLGIDNFLPAARGQRTLPHVRLLGKFRVRLSETTELHQDGFELGRFEAVFDTPLPLIELLLSQNDAGDAGNEGSTAQREENAAAIATQALEILEQQLVMLGQSGRYTFLHFVGEPPRLPNLASGDATTSARLEKLSFWLLGSIAMEDAERLKFLASTDTHARLAECRDRLKAAGRRSILNLPGADSWMHPGKSSLGSLLLFLGIIILLAAKAAGLLDSSNSHGRINFH